jgi:restriction system protein
MPVPDYQSIMLPLLQELGATDHPIGVKQLLPSLASRMGLTAEEIAERLPSGRQGLFHNRASWANLFMRRAGLVDAPRRGQMIISQRGRELLAAPPAHLNNEFLRRYPEFVRWQDQVQGREGVAGAEAPASPTAKEEAATPQERIARARQELEAGLRSDLLDRVREIEPEDFEALIVELLIKMGYGQGRAELGRVLGRTGDGGVDGVVNQDPLGLDRVYIQAKRYKSVGVPPDEINSFIGALNIKRANKGVFVTASHFTKQSLEHARSSTTHVVLIDGERLAALMIQYGVGVVVRETLEIKEIDEGFFED